MLGQGYAAVLCTGLMHGNRFGSIRRAQTPTVDSISDGVTELAFVVKSLQVSQHNVCCATTTNTNTRRYTCQVRDGDVGHSGLCCCTCVTYFEH